MTTETLTPVDITKPVSLKAAKAGNRTQTLSEIARLQLQLSQMRVKLDRSLVRWNAQNFGDRLERQKRRMAVMSDLWYRVALLESTLA